jgi:hypothetical protein
MAYSAITKAVANVVMDAKLSVIDDLITFLESKIEVDDDLKGIFEDFKSNLKESEEKVVKAAGKKPSKSKKSDTDEPKKKRAPSVFNLYVKDVMPSMKAKHPDVKDGKLMIGFASESWKSDPMAAFIKEKVLEMKKEDKTGDVVEMFAKAKAMYKGDSSDVEEVEEEEEEKSEVEESDVEESEVEEVIEKPKGKKVAEKTKVVEKSKAKGKTVKSKEIEEDDE